MMLAFQVASVLIAGVVVAIAWTSKATPYGVGRAIAVLAMAFGYIVFWGHVWQTGNGFWHQRDRWRTLSPAQAAVAGARPIPGLEYRFAEWIRVRIKPGDRFYLIPSPTRDEAVYQWFTYRLLPNLSSEEPRQSDWLIFYGTSPHESGAAEITGVVEQYAPGYSIARTRHAS
jgi:hypothetical protein